MTHVAQPAAGASPGAPPTDVGEVLGQLLSEQARIMKLARAGVDQGHGLSTLVTRHRGELEGVCELGRRMDTRLHDVGPSGKALMDQLERIKLLALNTGLEGARLGDPAGKGLLAVSEEFRSLAARSITLTDELRSTFDLLAQDESRLLEALGRAQTNQLALADQARESLDVQQRTLDEVAALGNRLGQLTGVDPSTVEQLSKIDDHVRQLEELLRPLRQSAAQPWLRSVLSPALESLTGLVQPQTPQSPEES
jgi:hypothetical protein